MKNGKKGYNMLKNVEKLIKTLKIYYFHEKKNKNMFK